MNLGHIGPRRAISIGVAAVLVLMLGIALGTAYRPAAHASGGAAQT